jgi:hypothetical protein
MNPTVQPEIRQARNPLKPMIHTVENGPEILTSSFVRMGDIGPETARCSATM